MSDTERLKNITRMEYKKPFGWFVRIQYEKKSFSKFFNDGAHGGKQSALLSALSWRDKKKQEIGMPITNLQVIGGARSNTGVRGVSYLAGTQKYNVSWVDANGRPNRTSVSCRKYGKEKAFEIACQIREEREQWRLNGNTLPVNKQKAKANRDPKKYTREELVEHLIAAYRNLGRIPTSKDFNKTRPNRGRYETMFGGWNNALVAAGLKPAKKEEMAE